MKIWELLADLVLVSHTLVVLFIVGGWVFIVVGGLCSWRSIRSLRFRLVHIGAIALVVVQSWFNAICPLTTLEAWLRGKADSGTYSGGFIAHWLQKLLFYEAPEWVFTLVYTLFGAAVVAAWWIFPPTSGRDSNGDRPDN